MTRKYSSISVQTTLATGISNTALSAVCATGTASTLLGGISLTAGDVDQFKIIFDPDTASAEIMYVTGVTSDTLTIARGKDGTSAVAHSGGAVIKHVLTGEDLTYFTTGVVPTSDLATGLPFPGSSSGTATLKAPAVAGTTTVTLPGATGTLATLAGTETFTNKTLTSPVVTGLSLNDASVVFEGTTADEFETTLTVTDPTADRTITLPNATGTVALAGDVIANTLTSATGDIIYASAANTPARLAVGATSTVLTVAAGVPTWAVLSFVTGYAYVATNEGTTSTSYTDLATGGPAVTVVTGTKALVIVKADMQATASAYESYVGFAVSSATTLAASDQYAAHWFNNTGNGQWPGLSAVFLVTGLTAGSNVFTAKYRMVSGNGYFAARSIQVIDLGS